MKYELLFLDAYLVVKTISMQLYDLLHSWASRRNWSKKYVLLFFL